MTGPDGRPVPFVKDRTEFSFNVNGRSGISVGRLTIPLAGSYKLTAKASSTDPFRLAVGQGVTKRLVAYVVGGVAVLLLGLGIGLALLIVTGVRRGRRKREYGAGLASGFAAAPGYGSGVPPTSDRSYQPYPGSPPPGQYAPSAPQPYVPAAPPWSPDPSITPAPASEPFPGTGEPARDVPQPPSPWGPPPAPR
jgi:hypothetical protein